MALHEIHWNPKTRAIHKGTIPVCEVVMTSFDGGPSIDTIGPIACPSCGVTCAGRQPREVS